jgi:hypothetical protein
MALVARFKEASTCYTIKLSSLQNDRPYPISHAERIDTRYGPAVLLSIRDSSFSLKKVFLPRRYSEVMTDDDIADINSGQTKLNLIYRGTCMQTGGHLLALREDEGYAPY